MTKIPNDDFDDAAEVGISMERLTKTINGVTVYIGYGNKFDNGMLAAELSVDKIRSVMCRLAAYEEIGMKPEEIKDFMKRWERSVEIAGMCKRDGIEHIRELLQAEKDGRLVVLPCKVGDTVYKLEYKPCHNGEDAPDSHGCCGCEDECDLKRDIFEYVALSVDWILQRRNRFGKGVWYLTREEAETALYGMLSDG